MRMTSRLALVAVVAAAMVAGLVPRDVTSGVRIATTDVVTMVDVPFNGPVTCSDATCGKAAPIPAAPSSGLVLAAVVGTLVLIAAATGAIRRRSGQFMALPAEARDPLFHPPQSS
jgi:hypothetical protein